MKNKHQENLIRESVREILIQEGFFGDVLGGIKTGVGKVYDFFADAVDADDPKSGIFKSLDDLAPDDPSSSGLPSAFQQPGQMSGYAIDSSSKLMPSPVDGVMQKSGVVWTDATLEFTKRMRAALDRTVPLTITSAARSDREQASAMLNKWNLGGDSELRKIYGKKAEEFIAAPKTLDAWEQIIKDRNSRSQRTSPHMRGVAVDIRTKDLSSSQVDALISAARAAGGRTLLEDTPEHLHVDGFSDSGGQVYT
jgi:hypothetical protein